MSSPNEDLLSAFDGHDADSVRAALMAGADACQPIRGKLPVNWLLQEYTRSDRLAECLRLLFDRGAVLDDMTLAPVLMDDPDAVQAAVEADPTLLKHRTTMISAFTSLTDVSLLHVGAEYGNLRAARALVSLGADVNAAAGIDEHGINGHTPLFHTVNSIGNRAEPIMRLLLDAGASVDVQLAGIEWGKGYEWETTFFDVTPISYAQIGLMPQVHRREREIYSNIRILMAAAGRQVPVMENIPNRYLMPKGKS